MTKRFKIGSKVRLNPDAEENENYSKYLGKVLTINHVATNQTQHPGFDSSAGSALYDCDNCNFSFYDWELEEA